VRGLCRFFVFASGHAAWVSTSNWKGASTPGNVGPGQVVATAVLLVGYCILSLAISATVLTRRDQLNRHARIALRLAWTQLVVAVWCGIEACGRPCRVGAR
jgi:hypothetical protein